MQELLKSTGAYRLLKTEAESENLSHAYLLAFEDGKNLRVALKTFAKLFFGCAQPTNPTEVRLSNLVDEENFSDCVFFPAEGKKLVVDDAEKILEESTLAPVEGEHKLFVLGDFAEANVQTQNKLLKLLEEPPKGVRFLLGATSVFPVLPTVLSRVKKLEILPFSENAVAECLRRKYGKKYEDSTLSLCAAASGGSVGDACSMLEGGYYQSLLEDAFSLLLSPSYRLPALVKTLGETPRKKELLTLLRLLCRDALLLKTGQREKHLLLAAEKNRVQEIADKFRTRTLLEGQEWISEAEKQVKFNAIFSQCLTLCMANFYQ